MPEVKKKLKCIRRAVRLRFYNQFLLTPNTQLARRDNLDVVLVSPRNPLNIGAAARAMANFGFSRLTVVAPYAPHWREARSAIGAPDLLASAVEAATLAEAVARCTLVVGTGSLEFRKPQQPVIALPDLPPMIERELARGGRIALVFGPEKHGLTREDLSYCHFLVEIPTDARQPSMNLGQAVAVCLYELASRAFSPAKSSHEITAAQSAAVAEQAGAVQAGAEQSGKEQEEQTDPGATSGDIELLAALIEETMLAADYSPASMRDANRHDLRLLLRRLAPAKSDTRRMMGLFRRILWRIQEKPKKE